MIFQALSGLFSLSGAIDRAFDLIDKKVDSETERQRLKTELLQEQLRTRRDVLVRGGWILQVAWAIPFIVYDAKLIIDKLFPSLGWATDPLSAELVWTHNLILGAVFLTTAIGRIKH